jgi:hypothetical protein
LLKRIICLCSATVQRVLSPIHMLKIKGFVYLGLKHWFLFGWELLRESERKRNNRLNPTRPQQNPPLVCLFFFPFASTFSTHDSWGIIINKGSYIKFKFKLLCHNERNCLQLTGNINESRKLILIVCELNCGNCPTSQLYVKLWTDKS